jgi:hypothetical protein
MLAVAMMSAVQARAEDAPRPEVREGTAPPDLSISAAPATAPLVINYQGRFTQASGTPLAGPVNIVFRLYNAAIAGTVIWTETHTGVELRDGVASVLLGSQVTFPFEAFTSDARYLTLVVDGGEEMTPRLRLASVPYALQAEKLGGKGAEDFELKGAAAALSVNDGNPPNLGSNRLHWNNLNGVPEGIADGEDAGVNDHGLLSGLGDDDHPQYAREADLVASEGEGPNTGKNLVHWENLVGVPAGFADDTDNGGGVDDHGDLTGLEDDDHPQYALDAELAAHDTSGQAHAGLARETELAAHAANASAHHTKTVDASELTAGTLPAERLPLNAVTGAHVLDASLTGSDLAASSVSGDRLIPGSVAGNRISAGTVGTAQLALASADSTHIKDGGISQADLATGAVNRAALAPAAVDSMVLATGAVTSRAIRDSSITGADIAAGALDLSDFDNVPGATYAGSQLAQVLGVSAVTVLTRTIDIPADGYVLAVGSGQGCIDALASGSELVLSFSVSKEGGSLDSIARLNYRVLGIVGVRQCAPLFSQRLYPVQKGFATFYLVAQGAADADMEVSSLGLSLLYFPRQY